jgi:hypothetical protein
LAREEEVSPELQAIYDKRFALCVTLNRMVNEELEKSVELYQTAKSIVYDPRVGGMDDVARRRENALREFEHQAQVALMFTELFNGACVEE